MESLSLLASTNESAAKESDLFGVLGIDWKLLVLQTVAFLIMLWVLKKFVYPPLTRALDERQSVIEESLKAAKDAEAKASDAQSKVEDMLGEARAQASEIVATAKTEAAATVQTAEDKAKARAQRVLDQAHEQVTQDIAAARTALKKDTVELIAMATEKVVRQKATSAKDRELISSTLKEVE